MTQTEEESPGRGSPPNTTSLIVSIPPMRPGRTDGASWENFGREAEARDAQWERERQAARAALAEKYAEEERRRTVAATARRAEKFADSLGVYRKVKTDPERPPYKPDETPVDPDTLEGRDLDLWKQLDRDDRAYFGYFKWINDQRAGTQQFTSLASEPSDIRSKLMKLADLENMAPAKPLIKGVLDLDSESWLIGQAGGFKSFVAIDWACHVASGTEQWRGHKVAAGDVLYVVAEGARGFAKRVKAWSQHHETSPDRLQILPMPVQAMGETARVLSADWLALVDIATELKPSLIVLDTQARMTLGLEENSAKEMGLWVEAVRALRVASGGCVLVVHHTGRNGGDARGSSTIDAAQDVEWKVERKAHQLAAVLKCEKSKDGDDRARFPLAMKIVPVGKDEDGQDITSLVLDTDVEAFQEAARGAIELTAEEAASMTTQEWIRRVLEVVDVDGSGITNTDLLGMVNDRRGQDGLDALKKVTFRAALSRMAKANDVFKVGAGRYTTISPDSLDDFWSED
jgi:hypothetical protein